MTWWQWVVGIAEFAAAFAAVDRPTRKLLITRWRSLTSNDAPTRNPTPKAGVCSYCHVAAAAPTLLLCDACTALARDRYITSNAARVYSIGDATSDTPWREVEPTADLLNMSVLSPNEIRKQQSIFEASPPAFETLAELAKAVAATEAS